MCEKIDFIWLDNGDDARIYNFLSEVDHILIPPLSERVDIKEYAKKLAQNAENIFVCWDNQDAGSCSVYCNSETAFISSFAVKPVYMRMKLGSKMMEHVINHAKELLCKRIRLEVHTRNLVAIAFYERCGFVCINQEDEWLIMEYKL